MRPLREADSIAEASDLFERGILEARIPATRLCPPATDRELRSVLDDLASFSEIPDANSDTSQQPPSQQPPSQQPPSQPARSARCPSGFGLKYKRCRGKYAQPQLN